MLWSWHLYCDIEPKLLFTFEMRKYSVCVHKCYPKENFMEVKVNKKFLKVQHFVTYFLNLRCSVHCKTYLTSLWLDHLVALLCTTLQWPTIFIISSTLQAGSKEGSKGGQTAERGQWGHFLCQRTCCRPSCTHSTSLLLTPSSIRAACQES